MRYSEDGAKVNRLFTFATIIIMAVVISLYTHFYEELTQSQAQKAAKNSGLPCQKEVVCFDKVYDKKEISQAIELFKKGNYTLDGEFEYSQYMPTILKDKIDPKEVEQHFYNAINITPNPNMQKIVKIYYQVVENDKQHPNKKSSKSEHCKLYAGYLITTFRVNAKPVFRMQIDFNDYDINEIKKRIDCTIESFLHHE